MALKERVGTLLTKLGINIERSLIEYSPSEIGSGIIKKQKAKNIQNIIIMNPEVTKELADKNILKDEIKNTANELELVSREDLIGYDLLTLSSIKNEGDLLNALALALPVEDIEALSIAMTIKQYEKHGQSEKALIYKNKLRRTYKERGNRILNFYGTGLLIEFLEDALRWLIYTPTQTEKIKVKTIFDRCIEYLEYAIFVNSVMPEERIKTELTQRFHIDRVNVVLIFGCTNRLIERIQRAIKEFETEELEVHTNNYELREEILEIGSSIHGIFVLQKTT